MSRLLRETNPVPGEKPGFLPQHLDANGNPVPTGENNPHPTKDKEVKEAIDLLQNKIIELNTQISELNQSVLDNNTVQIGNFPNVQNVADKNAQDELALIRTELNEKLLMIETRLKDTLDVQGNVQLTGSLTGESTQPKPQPPEGEDWEGYSYTEYNPSTDEVKIYMFISGDWRFLG